MGRKLRGKRAEPISAACNEDEIVALSRQLARKRLPETARRAGDQSDWSPHYRVHYFVAALPAEIRLAKIR
jgi:site-specific recombinase XerD